MTRQRRLRRQQRVPPQLPAQERLIRDSSRSRHLQSLSMSGKARSMDTSKSRACHSRLHSATRRARLANGSVTTAAISVQHSAGAETASGHPPPHAAAQAQLSSPTSGGMRPRDAGAYLYCWRQVMDILEGPAARTAAPGERPALQPFASVVQHTSPKDACGDVLHSGITLEFDRVMFAPGPLPTADGHPAHEGQQTARKVRDLGNEWGRSLTPEQVRALQQELGPENAASVRRLKRRYALHVCQCSLEYTRNGSMCTSIAGQLRKGHMQCHLCLTRTSQTIHHPRCCHVLRCCHTQHLGDYHRISCWHAGSGCCRRLSGRGRTSRRSGTAAAACRCVQYLR